MKSTLFRADIRVARFVRQLALVSLAFAALELSAQAPKEADGKGKGGRGGRGGGAAAAPAPVVPLSGQEKFDVSVSKLQTGLYQVAYSAKSDRLYVTAAGRGGSALLKLHPKTLAIETSVTPAKMPGTETVAAVYGVGVDDANGNVWVSNTRQNTVGVYRQSDLSLVKQFEDGLVGHSRDVIADTKRNKIYASGRGPIVVFDAKTLTVLKKIDIKTAATTPDATFYPMSLALDSDAGKLFTVSLNTSEAAVIDLDTDTAKVLPIEGATRASGVAYDAKSKTLFVASQSSNNLLLVDAETGRTRHNVITGGGALNVTFEPVAGLAYVTNRGGGTVTVVDLQGKIVANLPGGTNPNHLLNDGKGAVFMVNKARGADDPEGDRINRLTLKGK